MVGVKVVRAKLHYTHTQHGSSIVCLRLKAGNHVLCNRIRLVLHMRYDDNDMIAYFYI